jgi:hypothetical protein
MSSWSVQLHGRYRSADPRQRPAIEAASVPAWSSRALMQRRRGPMDRLDAIKRNSRRIPSFGKFSDARIVGATRSAA